MTFDFEKRLLALDQKIKTNRLGTTRITQPQRKVRKLAPLIAKLLKRPLSIDEQHAAAFFSELQILQRPRGKKPLKMRLGIRFSRFGKLFTLWSSNGYEGLTEVVLQRIKRLVEADGWNFTPTEFLSQPYSGKNRKFKNRTWGDRFFDFY